MNNILILGASGTLGKTLVSKLHNYNLFLAGRKYEDTINTFNLDLNDHNSIKDFLIKIRDVSLDCVIVNSGTYEPYSLNSLGVETNLMVNSFAPYYLIKKLKELNSNLIVVLTTSISILKGKLEFKPKKWHLIYRNTKLLEFLLFDKLKNEGLDIRYAHPGLTHSKLSLSLHSPLVSFFIKHFTISNDKAVKPIIMALDYNYNGQYWLCPKFFGIYGNPKLEKIKLEVNLNQDIIEYINEIERKIENGI